MKLNQKGKLKLSPLGRLKVKAKKTKTKKC